MFAVNTNIGALPKDARDVGLANELAVKGLLRPLAVQRSVTAYSGHGSKNEGATQRNSLRVALEDQIANAVSVGDVGVRERIGAQGDSFVGVPSGAGNIEATSSEPTSRFHESGSQGELVAVVGGVLVQTIFASRQDQNVAIGVARPVGGASGVREVNGSFGLVIASGVAVAAEVLEVFWSGLGGRGGRSATLELDARGVGGRIADGEHFAQGGFGIDRRSDRTETIVVGGVKLTDNVTIEVNIPTSKLLGVFAFGSGRGIQRLQVFGLALKREQAFARGDDDKLLDAVFANSPDGRRASPTSAELLTSRNQAVIGQGVGMRKRIDRALAIGLVVVLGRTLVKEQLLEAFGFHPTQPVAEHHRHVALQFAGESSFLLKPTIVRDSMTQEIHGQVVGTNAEVLGVVLDESFALHAFSVELRHGAERDFGASTLAQVANGHDRVTFGGTLKLLEEVFSRFGELNALLPKFGKKIGSLRRDIARLIVRRN